MAKKQYYTAKVIEYKNSARKLWKFFKEISGKSHDKSNFSDTFLIDGKNEDKSQVMGSVSITVMWVLIWHQRLNLLMRTSVNICLLHRMHPSLCFQPLSQKLE